MENNMERIMGLDVGDKTIGVAVSDLLMITAQGVTTIIRKNIKADIAEVRKIAREYNVTKIVVGMPKNMNGTVGPQAEKVIAFTERMKEKIKVPFEYQDERLTTVISEKILISADVRRENRKAVIDKIAAVEILSTYLDKNKNTI